MTIKQALDNARATLNKANKNIIERPRLEAEILLSNVLDSSREWLFVHENENLDNKLESRFFELVIRRLNYEPIEYLTNKVSFFDDVFYIDSGSLIPRSESEILVSKVIELIKKYNFKKAYEVGIGSAALSISIAKKVDDLIIYGNDISEAALNVARKNIKNFGLDSRILLKKASLLDGIIDLDSGLVFSNPPYIAKNYPLLENVLFEPESALFGGENGSELLIKLIQDSARLGVKCLVCEMGYNQLEIMKNELELNDYKAEFYFDLSGLPRGFVAESK